jgi:hypothetical protein
MLLQVTAAPTLALLSSPHCLFSARARQLYSHLSSSAPRKISLSEQPSPIPSTIDPATTLSEHPVYTAIHAERHAAWRAFNTPSQPKHPLRNPSSAPASSMRRTRSPIPRHMSHRHINDKAWGQTATSPYQRNCGAARRLDCAAGLHSGADWHLQTNT